MRNIILKDKENKIVIKTTARGDRGEKGYPGLGLPIGGDPGEVLIKKSGSDYDTEWSLVAGVGDMTKTVYDPQGKNADAFNRENMAGSQEISTVTGLQTALDNKQPVGDYATEGYVDGKNNAQDIVIGTKASKSYVDSENATQNTAISNKVDKVTGKGLSTNDYSNTEKSKLEGIEDGATADQTANEILPSQTGNTGKYLSTDGSNSSWQNLPGGGDMLASNNLSELTDPELARDNLEIGNVDNTSDASKPVSTAQQAALDTKVSSIVAGTGVTVDNTDPKNPVVNAAGGGGGSSFNPKMRYSLSGNTNQISLGSDNFGSFIIQNTGTGVVQYKNDGRYQYLGPVSGASKFSGILRCTSTNDNTIDAWSRNPKLWGVLALPYTAVSGTDYTISLILGTSLFRADQRLVGFKYVASDTNFTLYAMYCNEIDLFEIDITSLVSLTHLKYLTYSIDVVSGESIEYKVNNVLVHTQSSGVLDSGTFSTFTLNHIVETTEDHAGTSPILYIDQANLELDF